MSGRGEFRQPGLVLIGYRGTGKSTVGRIVAERLGRTFVDADNEIEARAGRPIRAIFAEQGEPAFRELEAEVLDDLAHARPGAVLATGGGAVVSARNRRTLREFGLVVWLRADPETLAGRLASAPGGVADRPALTSLGTLPEIASVLEVRAPLYQETAELAIETAGRSLIEVAETVLEAWNSRAGRRGR